MTKPKQSVILSKLSLSIVRGGRNPKGGAIMAKITENYESMVVFSTKEGDEAVAALVAKFKDMIEADATLTSVEEWGKRKLAYEINYETEGYYVLYNFESKPDFPTELNRVLNITDGVLRSIVVAKNG